ncbi:sodium-coupled monocarboxylate transporter 1 [Anabrus simplex]|uniref:sodium-coupled monocarboxylate transporter 1 n=1 Tax=Anabrus simplex TaxID=316456 RepID=UPI0034DCD786
MEEVGQLCEQHVHFGWEDYSVLAAMLVISTAIGLFYSCTGPKQTTSEDFLLGGSSMGTGPMSLSLAASFITAIELLGNPAEMYMHGTQFWMTCLSFLIVVPITSYLYLPVYRAINVTSAYEYLEMRFNSQARTVAAAMYVLQMALYTSVAVYAPALALSHVTGLNTYVAVTCVYGVCILYASQGGMKAVMMTDTFQAAVLVGSILVVLALGHSKEGAPSKIWAPSEETGRLEFFIMDTDPTVRHSFWSVVVGGSFYWATMFCSNQASIQKYLSVATIDQARTAVWVSAVSLILIFTINFYTGMVMYAAYHECDPLTSKWVSASDQLLPYYVMTSLEKFKGVPGFFVAGIFSASLGTVAAALNSLAAVTMKDFIQGAFNVQLPPQKGAQLGKWVSLVFGLLSFGLVFMVEQLGSVLQVALSFNGMVGGVTLGMFSLGMFFPWANSKGVLVGGITALALVMWIGTGAQVAIASGNMVDEPKTTSIEGCHCGNLTDLQPPLNTTELPETNSSNEVFSLYRLSYLWYSLLGCVVTVVVGLTTSLVTGPQDPRDLDPILVSPPVWRLLHALPQGVRDSLNLPLKGRKEKHVDGDAFVGGIPNLALSVEDEKLPSERDTSS